MGIYRGAQGRSDARLDVEQVDMDARGQITVIYSTRTLTTPGTPIPAVSSYPFVLLRVPRSGLDVKFIELQ